MDAPNYEFSEEQNAVILKLSKKMMFIGLTLIVLAAIYVFSGLYPLAKGALLARYSIGLVIGNVIGGAVYFVLGLLTIKAAKSFRLIVETQGSDVKNLMNAIAYLLKQYTIQFWLIILALILLLVAFLFLLLAWAAPVHTVG